MTRKVAPRLIFLLAGLAVVSGCALYSEVSISPLVLTPTSIERGSDIQSSVRRADFLRAIELASLTTSRNIEDHAAVGSAMLAAGRYDDARGRLRAAMNMRPFHTQSAQIAWNLSQVEYLSNNYAVSLEWALIARDNGLSIKKWHIDYLQALSQVPVYRFSGLPSAHLPLHFGRPDVPRVDVRVNRDKDVQAVVDTGAVLSIVSARFAASLKLEPFSDVEGQFFGLLGEPIPVRFGVLQSVELGEIVVHNVPVAIMADEKLRFFVTDEGKKEFNMDFLLGVNFLKEFRLKLDFDRNRLEMTKLTDRDRRPAPDQNVFFEGFRPHVRGTINRRGWYLFVLDTGSEVTFLNETHVGQLPLNQIAPLVHGATLQGLGGAKKRGTKVEEVELGLDRWAGKFKTLPMYSTDEKDRSAGIIGENLLKHFNVVLDFGRMRLDLERR